MVVDTMGDSCTKLIPDKASNPRSHNTIDGGEDERETEGFNDEIMEADSSNDISFKEVELPFSF